MCAAMRGVIGGESTTFFFVGWEVVVRARRQVCSVVYTSMETV